MIRYIYADNLHKFPKLRDTMFRDRAEQFRSRLGWDVQVDENGFERDEYDGMNPLYAIWERADGTHGGSMRFMPTTGRTMVNDHFLFLTDEVRIESPLIWECTRFCLAPDANRRITAALVIAADDLMHHHTLMSFVGVFDQRMERVYKTLGVAVELLGQSGEGPDQIDVGLLFLREECREKALSRAGITEQLAKQWFDFSFCNPATLSTKTAEFALA
ncbi:MAG: acyl-homoserine-lactone synthase [Litoreibacter sp.]